tara:strand:+ start:2025 stop:2216 length:192 start_codon:yes stop_codon:yes gene_type:complete
MDSFEKKYLESIISFCELMLDDIDNGAVLDDQGRRELLHINSFARGLQLDLQKQLTPSNINEN